MAINNVYGVLARRQKNGCDEDEDEIQLLTESERAVKEQSNRATDGAEEVLSVQCSMFTLNEVRNAILIAINMRNKHHY